MANVRFVHDPKIRIGRAGPAATFPTRGFLLTRIASAARRSAQCVCNGQVPETLQQCGPPVLERGQLRGIEPKKFASLLARLVDQKHASRKGWASGAAQAGGEIHRVISFVMVR
jgi:hypothetical protein